ncbi:hypothetical protein [Lysinibacter cavernae]|uniref:YrhK domain-containing protein n=1 Tax=Lysinibacter cavernae TaxID=1640652 RepID=A0A7X5QZT3_9MICO|nr:hypothetical protein [Lysinibacter cavernae]NIH52963.1 hypothetical protein [Lysinibacter cavernae]
MNTNRRTPSSGAPRARPLSALTPNLTKQSWSFMIGSAMFAVGTAIGMLDPHNSNLTNIFCFFGAWFFTAAGLMQLALSGSPTTRVSYGSGTMFRAEWLAAATQTMGTLLFNVSTSAALTAKTVRTEDRLVWTPDAGGSMAFLISAAFVYVAFVRSEGTMWDPTNPGWWGAHINMIGCLAFGFSAIGAFVLPNGTADDLSLANWGTFIGALCFFTASAIALPKRRPLTA